MKRRRFLKAMVAAPAAPALVMPALGQQPAAPGPQGTAPVPQGQQTSQSPPSPEIPRLETAVADDAAEMLPKFFNQAQFAALRKLSGILMPPIQGAPGALEAHAPEFLDFLLSESPAERKQLYTSGLNLLNEQSRKRFGKPFAEVDAAQATALLSPLRQPWTYEPPSDPLARFLVAAKADVRTATINSRQFSAGSGSAPGGQAGGGRRPGGMGQYWHPLD